MSDPNLDKLSEQILDTLNENAEEGTSFRLATDEEVGHLMARWREAHEAALARAEASGKTIMDEERDHAIIDAWYDQARHIRDMAGLIAFLGHLEDDYFHDYGSMCRAAGAAAVATASYFAYAYGMTGFQAGAVQWEFIRHWDANMCGKDTPQQLVCWRNALFPQYEDHFGTISRDAFAWLQQEAQKELAGMEPDDWRYEHLSSIAAGTTPFGLRPVDR